MLINHICEITCAYTQHLTVFLHLPYSPLTVILIVADIQPDGLLL